MGPEGTAGKGQPIFFIEGTTPKTKIWKLSIQSNLKPRGNPEGPNIKIPKIMSYLLKIAKLLCSLAMIRGP